MLGVVGIVLISIEANWLVALGVFLLIWANNFDVPKYSRSSLRS